LSTLFCSSLFYCGSTTFVTCLFSLNTVIAHKSTSAEIGILRKLFQQCDTEGKGYLNYEQFKAAIADTSLQEDDYRRIFEAVVRLPMISSMEHELLYFRFNCYFSLIYFVFFLLIYSSRIWMGVKRFDIPNF
jgi:hypothetical protein